MLLPTVSELIRATCLTSSHATCLTQSHATCLTSSHATCLTSSHATCLTSSRASCLTSSHATCVTSSHATCLTSYNATCLTFTCMTSSDATCLNSSTDMCLTFLLLPSYLLTYISYATVPYWPLSCYCSLLTSFMLLFLTDLFHATVPYCSVSHSWVSFFMLLQVKLRPSWWIIYQYYLEMFKYTGAIQNTTIRIFDKKTLYTPKIKRRLCKGRLLYTCISVYTFSITRPCFARANRVRIYSKGRIGMHGEEGHIYTERSCLKGQVLEINPQHSMRWKGGSCCGNSASLNIFCLQWLFIEWVLPPIF